MVDQYPRTYSELNYILVIIITKGPKDREKQEYYVMTRVGCMLAHYLAVKTAYDNNLENVLILEDDIIIDDNFNEWIKSVNIDFECDILYLGGDISHINNDINKNKYYININPKYTRIFGTQGRDHRRLQGRLAPRIHHNS